MDPVIYDQPCPTCGQLPCQCDDYARWAALEDVQAEQRAADDDARHGHERATRQTERATIIEFRRLGGTAA